MSYVTSVERIGRKKGHLLGLKEGRKEGKKEGGAALLLRQLTRKFGAEVGETVRKRIVAADTSQLEEWGERILTATSLAEVFGEV